MKKVIATITADIHARATNPRCRIDDYNVAMKKKLNFLNAWRKGHTYGVPHLDAGDLFHSSKSTPATQTFLIQSLPDSFITIPGNHEIPFHNLNRLSQSSWQVLFSARRILSPRYEIEELPDYIYVAGELGVGDGYSIALMHGMVWEEKPTHPDIEGISAVDLLKQFPKYQVIVTGHNHKTFTAEHEGRILINPGSMMRSSIDQIDFKPCFFVLYDDLSFESIPFPIEKDVFAEDAYKKKEERDGRLEAFIERVQDTEGFTLNFDSNIKTYCKKNKVSESVQQEINQVMVED